MNQEPSSAALSAPKRFRYGFHQTPCVRSFGVRIAPDAEAILLSFTSREWALKSAAVDAFVNRASGR